MIGPPGVVQPPVSRAARARDACLWHVSSVGGARRRGCAAAGVPGCSNVPLEAEQIALHDGPPALQVGGEDELTVDEVPVDHGQHGVPDR